MKHAGISVILASLFILAAVGSAQNLILDSECNLDPDNGELAVSEGADQCRFSRYTEEFTWNNCLKFELVNVSVDKEGKRHVGTGMRFGGTKELHGFPCKPDTTYRFSLEIRGTAPRAMLNVYEWTDGQSNSFEYRRKNQTSIHLIRPEKEWTVYTGTFRTGPDAKRAALGLQFWGDEAKKDFQEEIGQYVLADKIKIEEVRQSAITPGKPVRTEGAASFDDTKPAKVCIVPDTPENPAVLTDFRDYKEDKPSDLPSRCLVWREGDKLHFKLDFQGVKPEAAYSENGGNDIWFDDFAEFFFAPVKQDRLKSQFVVSAGGGRWMGHAGAGDPDPYDKWQAKCEVRPDGWSADVVIPFSLLGYDSVPGEGESIGFNLGRQHTAPGVFDKQPDWTKGNRWGMHRMYDNSSWSFGYGERENFGTLFFGTMKPYAEKVLSEITSPELAGLKQQIDLADPGLAFARLMQLKEKDRLLKLASEKFLAAQIRTSTDPALPFLPEELNHPQKEFRLTAAVNEHAPLAVALANMTGEFEEYRVTVECGWEHPDPQVEGWYPASGLKTADGTRFPAEKITIRRGVKGRDSDAPNASARYDILSKLNEASTVPVPAWEGALLWITFDCHNVKPGEYTGKFVISPLTGNRLTASRHVKDGLEIKETLTKEIPIRLTVLPFELDDNAMPLNGYRTALRQYHFDFMKEYRHCMYMVTPWYFTADFAPDGTIREAKPRPFLLPHLELLRKNLEKMPKGVRPVMVGYGAYDIFKRIHMRGTKIEFDSPAWWNAWREWCIMMDGILTESGIARDDYVVEVLDEPNPNEYPVAEVRKAFEVMREAVPGIHLTITSGINAYGKEIGPLADHWIFYAGIVHNREKVKDALEYMALPDRKWSVYMCGTSMRQDLYRYYRILPWTALEIHSEAVSLYQFFAQNPGTDFRRAAKDGEVAYDTSHSLIPSVRLENLRIGMDDARYLLLLEKLAAGDSAEAKAARTFLKKAARDVASVYPHDAGKADEVRQKAVEWILKLKR
ncbi:MAG: hypothetical protein J5944_06375 [Lentisphaeria bacterium]|nr:hypothetical protein [Lentisphaeria bacterium]